MGFSLVRYQFALPVHLLPEIAPYAEEIGIRMGVEVHAPMWAGHPAVQAYGEMYDKLNTPVLRTPTNAAWSFSASARR